MWSIENVFMFNYRDMAAPLDAISKSFCFNSKFPFNKTQNYCLCLYIIQQILNKISFVEQNVAELENYQILSVNLFWERPASDFLPFNMPSKIAGEFLKIIIQISFCVLNCSEHNAKTNCFKIELDQKYSNRLVFV